MEPYADNLDPIVSGRFQIDELPSLGIGDSDTSAQYARLLRYAGQDCLVFFPFGRFIEFYGPQRILAASLLALRSVSLSRAVFAFTAGFPGHLAGIYAERAIRQHLAVVYVSQDPSPQNNGCKVRVPHRIWLPIGKT